MEMGMLARYLFSLIVSFASRIDVDKNAKKVDQKEVGTRCFHPAFDPCSATIHNTELLERQR